MRRGSEASCTVMWTGGRDDGSLAVGEPRTQENHTCSGSQGRQRAPVQPSSYINVSMRRVLPYCNGEGRGMHRSPTATVKGEGCTTEVW
jgi:hypothetical protein